MSKTENQEKAFQFLRQKFNTQELFTLDQFQEASGFKDSAFGTYVSKHYGGLLLLARDNQYRVSTVFRQFSTWRKFRDKVVTQNRNFGRRYDHLTFETVVMFEFYMPLRNEELLRDTLDSLFEKDSIKFRLNLIDRNALEGRFPRNPSEESNTYLTRVCEFVSDKFVGYSVHHVNGRFRRADLKTRAELLQENSLTGEKYFVDETTAVVRFIFPCQSGTSRTANEDANLIRWFFEELFVQSILEVVNAEDEIWLLESGIRNCLHVWRAQD